MPNQPDIDKNHLIGLDGNLYTMTTISSNLNLVIPVEDQTSELKNAASNCLLNLKYAVIGNPCEQLRNLLLSTKPSSGGEPVYNTETVKPKTIYKNTITLPTTDNTIVTVNTDKNIPPSIFVSLPKSTPELPKSTPEYIPAKTPTYTPTKTPAKTPTYTPTKTPTKTPAKTPTKTPAKTPTYTPTYTPDESDPNSTSTFTSTIYPIETFGKSHNNLLQLILIILSLVLIGYCYYDKN